MTDVRVEEGKERAEGMILGSHRPALGPMPGKTIAQLHNNKIEIEES